jgi:hypothetical protein
LTGQQPFVLTNTATLAARADDPNGSNDVAQHVLTNCVQAATAVRVLAFRARAGKRAVTLEWRTASELDAVGFNVLRTRGPATTRVNRRLVPARGSQGVAGASYRLVDRSVLPGRRYVYRLQLVELDGTRVWSGTASVRASR